MTLMSKIIEGKCIICPYKGRILDTDTDNHKFGLCEICFAAIDDLTASKITNVVLGGPNN